MTPIDIATSIDALDTIPGGDVTWSTSATYYFSGGQSNIADDQRSWD